MNLEIVQISKDSLYDLALVFAIVFLVAMGLYLAKVTIKLVLEKIQITNESKLFFFQKFFQRINIWLFIAVGFFVASRMVEVKKELETLFFVIVVVLLGYHAIYFLNYVLSEALIKTLSRDNDDYSDFQEDKTVVRFISVVFRSLMWGLLVIIILQNIGYNVSALLGGLGIVGLAVAFAVQNILEDIFSFLSIYFDKPFRVGDFITINQDSGTIQKIGIKTTRIKTLEGQELIVSNKELTSIRINNYKRMDERRVQFQIGVEYSTSNSKLKQVNKIIEGIFDELKIAYLDRVHFKEFGDFALIFEVVYYVKSPDYKVYMDVQQKINFEIKERFEKEQIEMAFPTQKIILQK
ncbi:MAG: mechanosensitive ion channel protein MscS [Candidatus Dojkabacteria bacterium]|nr:MAG: mechanosensitive ion channel protein MscS [Candidatus Dojkabacteria bacterium]GIW58902.1 MAG: mechanosensitive ion channel protein MscS [Candidatus Dojkabacteria bacterium]